MSLIKDILEKPSTLSPASKYTVVNGVIYVGLGVLLIVWPGVVQTVFMEPPFVGHEGALVRVIGLTILVIGWLYFFGGLSGSRQFIAAGVIDRLIFVPLVLVPLAIAGVFTHFLGTFAIFDPSLAMGAWLFLGRKA